jgi:hypothetical protein
MSQNLNSSLKRIAYCHLSSKEKRCQPRTYRNSIGRQNVEVETSLFETLKLTVHKITDHRKPSVVKCFNVGFHPNHYRLVDFFVGCGEGDG